MSKFAQSEWTAKGFTIYEQKTGLRVASIDNKGHLKETAERNTRLIAAAPKMYDELCTTARVIRDTLPLIPNLTDTFLDCQLDCIEKLLARIDGEQEVKE